MGYGAVTQFLRGCKSHGWVFKENKKTIDEDDQFRIILKLGRKSFKAFLSSLDQP